MPKISKSFNFKDFFSKFVKNTAWLFLAGLVIILIFEVLEIKKSVNIILSANVAPAVSVPERGIRIDFEGYNRVMRYKQSAQSFYPTTTPTTDPFYPVVNDATSSTGTNSTVTTGG